ncbi:SPOR domain-containing protein [Thiofilum flexile]|uniref:SPOR domain-containing protein n=1 Tax=Thiofilum flexile TaxID=125627 RepID=UPI0003764A37|nr:SPOR domain-containing protein [Thiofilum flexile]
MSQPVKSSQGQKGGIRLYHVLLIVILVVGTVLLYKKGLIPGISSLPTMSQITEKLPTVSLPTLSSNNTNTQPGVNVSVGVPEGELLNDEWVPPSDDNSVYQDNNESSISLMTQEPAPVTKTQTVQEPKPVTRPKRVTPPAPVKVKNPPPEFPANLANGYYTVQVYAGYNSKTAYSIRRSLEQDGYLVYIYRIEDRTGMLFRVRIGRYANLNSARAVRDQIRRRYPKHLSQSFVMMRQSTL